MPRAEPKAPKPIETYGLPPLPGTRHTQLNYERMAFRLKWPIEKGGLPRYQHFRNGCKILWPWLKWNPWMERECEEFCNEPYVGVAGCAGCVSGDTRILNPVTGEQPTIEELTRKQIAPVVMTLDGPEQAGVPFVKGYDELFEITLHNGTKFTATAEHLVLTPEGFQRVGSLATFQRLLGYERVPPQTISGGVPSSRASSVPSSRKIVAGSRADCRLSLRCDDEQLPSARAAAQSSAPSHSDVPKRNRGHCSSDDQASRVSHSPVYSECARLSNSDSLSLRKWFSILGIRRAFRGTVECIARWFQSVLRFPLLTPSHAQGAIPFHGSAHKLWERVDTGWNVFGRRTLPSFHYSQDDARSASLEYSGKSIPEHEAGGRKPDCFSNSDDSEFLSASELQVAQNTIVSIRSTGHATYYDITVPKAAHYFAEGSIHHNSSKTTGSVIYGVFWWLCGIQDSAFVLTSTTKGNIRSRAWNWVQKLYTTVEGPRIGNMVDSRTTWQGVKGDDRHCVCALPVREGSTNKAVGRLQGFHPDGRMLIVIDEGTDTPEAIFDALPNLTAGNWDFQVIVLFNPNSRFDPAGKFVTPLNGWGSVSVESDEWETQIQLNGKPGKAIHFDAEKSPNVVAGQVLYEHLPTLRTVEAARKKLGGDSPWYWKFYRGFLPPEGVVQTVLTESLLERHEAVGERVKHIFVGGPFTSIAFLDPAFGGGDKAILRIGKFAEIEGGGVGIQLTKSIPLHMSATAKDDNGKLIPIHYQLSRQFIWHCKDNGVESRHAGLDSTGEGGGLADIVSQEWNGDIQRVEFGGKPSERRVSNEDERPCDEVYDRKVTELHFTVKEFVVSGQLKGMNSREANDLVNRLWRMKGRKIEIEPKTKRKGTGDAEETSNFGFKERMGRSPDDGDALCGLCEVARRVGVAIKTQGRTARASDDWNKIARKMDEIYAETEDGKVDAWAALSGVQDSFAMEEV